MSFTKEVKDEILKNSPSSEYQIKYELEAFFQHTLSFPENNTIMFKSESKIVTKRFLNDIELIYGISLDGLFDFSDDVKTTYEFELENEAIFNDALIANSASFNPDEMSPEHKKIYIATTFLIAGYILNPEKNYHIEFAFTNNVLANHLKNCLLDFDIILKSIEKKNLLILYIKDSEQISNFLGIVNAYNALLNMENIKIYKDVRNSINRNVNCETANLKKTINASLKQIDAIKKISMLRGLNSLPTQLYEVAEARLNNQDLNLQELADQLGISKSCINHRFRRIIEIAEELK
ncbi:MAG: DNA-binding protein WhiA [Clostridia bacterium]|nr:DNA-binding protein WhiA [Clostridia bacterium]